MQAAFAVIVLELFGPHGFFVLFFFMIFSGLLLLGNVGIVGFKSDDFFIEVLTLGLKGSDVTVLVFAVSS